MFCFIAEVLNFYDNLCGREEKRFQLQSFRHTFKYEKVMNFFFSSEFDNLATVCDQKKVGGFNEDHSAVENGGDTVQLEILFLHFP